MSLTTDTYARGRRVHTLTACPCGFIFSASEPRWKHLLDEHKPEDFGLSPLGEIPDGHDRPLYRGETA
ncbi:hypothetical protein [Halobacterium zhouii]|uniref:hypothetical protein n=1 Tax=Halobacterium zhouii TaxID=2902624 RepID=UPI001E5EB0F5|nr:hypothetical protein [Halobacterium zhouii]